MFKSKKERYYKKKICLYENILKNKEFGVVCDLKTILKKFKVYAPPDKKAYGLNEDGTLTITGIASTTNEDLDGEIITPDALQSLERQVVGLNLHLDHNHNYEGGIGVITEAEIQDNSLRITAIVLPEYAVSILQKLNIGMNMGFSIGGIPVINSGNSRVINDFVLLEVSLTLLPANWDTYGTVETKAEVKSKCLTGACHYILKSKNKSDTMSEKDFETSTPVDENIKQELVNIVNEAVINLKPVILDELRGELGVLVQDVVAQALVDVLPTIEEPVEEFACNEEPIGAKASDEETVPEEEVPVEEEKDATEETEEPVEEETVPEEEVPVEEEKEITAVPQPSEVPVDGVPASPEDVEYVPSEPPLETPTYVLDSKAIADQVVAEVFKKLSNNRKTSTSTSASTGSKLKAVKKSQLQPTKQNRFLDGEKRDKFGRNRKYI